MLRSYVTKHDGWDDWMTFVTWVLAYNAADTDQRVKVSHNPREVLYLDREEGTPLMALAWREY